MNQVDRVPPSISLKVPSCQLEVRFEWIGDRFQHQVRQGDDSLLVSIEGNADQAWPDSPPLQQLSHEHLEGRDVVLGVGAAGKSHWSLCVMPIEGADETPALRFEWACRTTESQPHLRSSYEGSSAKMTLNPGETSDCEKTEIGFTIRPDESSAPTKTWQWSYDVAIPPQRR